MHLFVRKEKGGGYFELFETHFVCLEYEWNFSSQIEASGKGTSGREAEPTFQSDNGHDLPLAGADHHVPTPAAQNINRL